MKEDTQDTGAEIVGTGPAHKRRKVLVRFHTDAKLFQVHQQWSRARGVRHLQELAPDLFGHLRVDIFKNWFKKLPWPGSGRVTKKSDGVLLETSIANMRDSEGQGGHRNYHLGENTTVSGRRRAALHVQRHLICKKVAEVAPQQQRRLLYLFFWQRKRCSHVDHNEARHTLSVSFRHPANPDTPVQGFEEGLLM